MISQDDFDFINAYDNADSAGRSKILAENRTQAAKTFPSLLEHVSKDQTIQYILVLIDDMLQVCAIAIFNLSCALPCQIKRREKPAPLRDR